MKKEKSKTLLQTATGLPIHPWGQDKLNISKQEKALCLAWFSGKIGVVGAGIAIKGSKNRSGDTMYRISIILREMIRNKEILLIKNDGNSKR